MSKVRIGMISQEGDQLGHLVRGVQMLRSYGHEFEVQRYSKLISLDLDGVEASAICCFLDGHSAATLAALQSICRETEWALGDQPTALRVWLVQVGNNRVEAAPQPLLQAERQDVGRHVYLAPEEFRKICEWGQRSPGSDSKVTSEWPSTASEG